MSSQVIDDETHLFGRLLHYAGLAIVLVVGAVAYHLFYTPVEARILEAEMKIDELQVAGANTSAIRAEHGRLSGQLREINARFAALTQRVPLNAETSSFLKHVSEIAREAQLEISSFQPAQSENTNGYTTMEVMLDGRGSYASICSFFERLSKLQRLSKVKDLTVSVDPQADKYPMQVTILIYFGLENVTTANAREEVRRG
jgi:type IV pilus assembly protein PilO